MNTTTSTKTTGEGALPKRNPKTGRFEKGMAKAAKPPVDKAKGAVSAKPASGKAKKG